MRPTTSMSRVASIAAITACVLAALGGGAGAAIPVNPPGPATLRLEVVGLGANEIPAPYASLGVEDQLHTFSASPDPHDMTTLAGASCPGVSSTICTTDLVLTVPGAGTGVLISPNSTPAGRVLVFSGDCTGVGNRSEPTGALDLAPGQTKICRASFAAPDDAEAAANAVVVLDKTFDLDPSAPALFNAPFLLARDNATIVSTSVDDFRSLAPPETGLPAPRCRPAPTTHAECEWVTAFVSTQSLFTFSETAPGWLPLFGGDCAPGGRLPDASSATFYRYELFRCSVENVLLEGGEPDPAGVLRLELVGSALTNEGVDIEVGRFNGTGVATLGSDAFLDPAGEHCRAVSTALCTGDVGVARSQILGHPESELRIRVQHPPLDTVGITMTGDCEQVSTNGEIVGNVTVLPGRKATCRVTLDIQKPVVSVSPVSTVEGDSGTKTVLVPVTLNRAAIRTVTVPWSTADNTATAPSDYQSASGTVTFTAGQSSATIPVVVVGDLRGEAAESLYVVLGTPVNATVGSNRALVTIQNNDDTAPPLIAAKTDVTVEAKLATGQTIGVVYTSPLATDAKDGVVSARCVARSGSQFALGRTQVTCSATDLNFNTSVREFTVVVRLPLTSGAVSAPGNLDQKLTEVSPGRRVRVTAGGFAPGSLVQLVWVTSDGGTITMGSATADAAGRIDTQPKIPITAPQGAGQIVANGVAADVAEFVRGWRLQVVS